MHEFFRKWRYFSCLLLTLWDSRILPKYLPFLIFARILPGFHFYFYGCSRTVLSVLHVEMQKILFILALHPQKVFIWADFHIVQNWFKKSPNSKKFRDFVPPCFFTLHTFALVLHTDTFIPLILWHEACKKATCLCDRIERERMCCHHFADNELLFFLLVPKIYAHVRLLYAILQGVPVLDRIPVSLGENPNLLGHPVQTQREKVEDLSAKHWDLRKRALLAFSFPQCYLLLWLSLFLEPR